MAGWQDSREWVVMGVLGQARLPEEVGHELSEAEEEDHGGKCGGRDLPGILCIHGEQAGQFTDRSGKCWKLPWEEWLRPDCATRPGRRKPPNLATQAPRLFRPQMKPSLGRWPGH